MYGIFTNFQQISAFYLAVYLHTKLHHNMATHFSDITPNT